VNAARAVALSLALACGAALPSARAQQAAPQKRPALEPARVGGEVLAGTYAGLGGFLLGRFAGGAVAGLMPDAAESTRDNIAHWTGLLAGGAATAGGVYAVGAMGNQTGSYPLALLGAGAGYAAVLAVTHLIDRPSGPAVTPQKSHARWLEATVESLLPAIGATIAFNSSRRFK
jgi:hypothetical protein